MIPALILGVSYGFAAGVGPTLCLIIAPTRRCGGRAGNLVARAPLFTNLPIILLAVFLVGQLPRGAFSCLGAVGGLCLTP